MRDYVREIELTDIHLVDGIRRDASRVAAVIKALARNVSTEATITTIARDAQGFSGLDSLHDDTTSRYVDSLARAMVVEDQPAWRPHLRSRARVRVAPKRHFVDPSIAIAALAARTEDLRADISFLGRLFESLVVRDLRVLTSPAGGSVSHYRDSTGLEVGAIVTLGYRRWGAFEVKLAASGPPIEHAAKSLLKFADTIDRVKVGEPAVLAIITATGYAYLRTDGIHVIPIRNLAP